ncbi:peptidylprolyl isomerase [Longispora albida]|uniref:peptidylprolyl isomerase n=1 Tax=Longispora albida TaxID=203523 RepID=UPI00037CB6CA|nr:peptidylprolyl isomerase [Longispora albida]
MTSNRERQQREAARQKLQAEMTVKAEAAQKRKQLQTGIGAAVAVVLVVALGVWGGIALFGKDSKKPSAQPSTEPGACQYKDSERPGTRQVGKPGKESEAPGGGTRVMTLNTNLGKVEIEMDATKAPCTTASFTHLAEKKYFDGTSCHRVANDPPMLQCGDPAGNGSGGPGYQFANENLPKGKATPYPKGTVAMANAGPDTNGSQFFIMHKDSTLSADYTVLGKVITGQDIVDQVAAAGDDGSNSAGGGKPKKDISFTSVTVSPVKPPAGVPSGTPSSPAPAPTASS